MGRFSTPDNAEDWIPLLEVGPFIGIDPTTDPYYVKSPMSVDMVNILPNQGYGGFYTAPGRSVFNSAKLPGKCKGLTKFSLPGEEQHYIYGVDIGEFPGNGALYSCLEGGVPVALTLPSGYSLTWGAQYQFVPYGQWCFVTNGIDTPLKIDFDLQVTYWGIVAPTTAPIVIAGGAGSLNSPVPYYYTVTFGNAEQESSQGFNPTTKQTAVSNPITLTNQTAILTNIPTSSDPQVTQRNIYRLGGSQGTWVLVHTLNDNTTTTWTDTTTDPVVGQQLVVFRDPPPIFSYIHLHMERIWGFSIPDDPSVVWWSNIDEPWGFNPSTNTLPVGNQALNDVAKGMSETGNILTLNKSNSVYGVYGTTDSNFTTALIEYTGTIATNSCIEAYGSSYWLSRQGFYTWNGSSAGINLSDGLFQQSNIKKILQSLSDDDLKAACCFKYDRMIGLSFPTINMTYMYDLRTQSWSPLSWATDQAYSDPNDLYQMIGQNLEDRGSVVQWFTGGGDLGSAVTSYILSAVTDSGSINSTKTYRYYCVEASNQNAQMAMELIVNPGTNQFSYVSAVPLIVGPVTQQSLLGNMQGHECQLKLSIISEEIIHVQRVSILGQVKRLNVAGG